MARPAAREVRRLAPVTGRPHALDRPLIAAAAASQAGRWDEAIALWRDQLRRPKMIPLAAGCIAEAALRSDRRGLADQMLLHMGGDTALIDRLRNREISTFEGMSDEVLAERFRSDHPLGERFPASSSQGAASLRRGPACPSAGVPRP